METSTYALRARQHAAILIDALDAGYPSFRGVLVERGARIAVQEVLGLPAVAIVDDDTPGCSVAGSCDTTTGGISVVRASAGRMSFTILHELAHVRGNDDFDFQEALAQAEQASRRAVEEDACEAFAAELLLPAAVVDPVVDLWGVTARAVAELVRSSLASREACAVAVAHRMAAPGYVAIVDDTEHLRFAARSGDVLPLRRGSDQSRSVVRHLHDGREHYRDRDVLIFGSGAPTDEMFVDVLVDGPVLYVVATTDSAAWVKVSLPRPFSEPTGGWCDHCQTSFQGGRVCGECHALVHAVCGHCECEKQVRTAQRVCTTCFMQRPATMFVGTSTVCSECSV